MEIKLLSCPLCLKPNFQGVDALRSSLISVATSQISCPVCNEHLLGLDKLTIHLFSHITTIVAAASSNHPQQVPESSKHFDVPKIEANPQPEHKENKTIQEESNKCLRCDICNFCFGDENILEMHQKLLHQTSIELTTGTYSYHCHLCSKKFKMKGSLMVHLRVAHYGFGGHQATDGNCSNHYQKNSSGEDKDQFKTSTGNDSKGEVKSATNAAAGKVQDNKQWECDVCSKMFTTKYFLKKHKRLHTGEMPYFCTLCSKSFTFQQSYHKHMLYHSSEKPHVCNECGRAFKELSTLHNHERIHSGERPFACETCGKCFRQRVSYLVHRRIHTGVMPYKCTACDKSFRYKVSQRSHKCTANPAGSVVRAPETLVAKSTIISNTQIENVPSQHTNPHESADANQCMNTLVFNSKGEIIAQNFSMSPSNDGQNQISMQMITEKHYANGDGNSPRKEADLHRNKSPVIYVNDNNDFLSMVLSPVLPDVQSLCLTQSPDDRTESMETKQTFQTINEESLKELLYGKRD